MYIPPPIPTSREHPRQSRLDINDPRRAIYPHAEEFWGEDDREHIVFQRLDREAKRARRARTIRAVVGWFWELFAAAKRTRNTAAHCGTTTAANDRLQRKDTSSPTKGRNLNRAA